jgi:hypothetical protein
MKALLLKVLLLGCTSAMAKRLVVLADIALLPESGYATMPKDAGCDKQTDSGDLLVMCVGGWSRYRLTGVTLLNGTRFGDTIALIYADPVLGGRWRLTLRRLDASEAASYCAKYTVVSASRANEARAP